jgi:predicted lipoprotein with Yx(FWY)xxD motif
MRVCVGSSVMQSLMNGATLNKTSALGAVAAVSALVGAAGCGSSTKTESTAAAAAPATTTSAPATASAGGAALTAMSTSLGTVLVAGPKHLTVYLFEGDKGTTSTCSGACASIWPPVSAPSSGTPKVEGGLNASLLGTTTRSDGSKQLTYAGHPLYYYAADHEQGQTTGQGLDTFGAHWYVLGSTGSAIKTAASSSSSSSEEGGGYHY